ncbi:hypothetical protein F6X53_19395 [Methylobacterium soli]|uniref:Uncharacterized protein n=1 Tax=Methylobacterium soli TaxID=553447 RepID=A0A6L3SYR1_9HYPH|nr:hypothetical protein F6X53_19395 [Methylobacterium soli]
MERLCDIAGRRLIVECLPCRRRGVYDLARLRERFGEHADVYDVWLRLTQSCRHQHALGARRPNQYGRACRAQLDVEAPGQRSSLRSRT